MGSKVLELLKDQTKQKPELLVIDLVDGIERAARKKYDVGADGISDFLDSTNSTSFFFSGCPFADMHTSTAETLC